MKKLNAWRRATGKGTLSDNLCDDRLFCIYTSNNKITFLALNLGCRW